MDPREDYMKELLKATHWTILCRYVPSRCAFTFWVKVKNSVTAGEYRLLLRLPSCGDNNIGTSLVEWCFWPKGDRHQRLSTSHLQIQYMAVDTFTNLTADQKNGRCFCHQLRDSAVVPSAGESVVLVCAVVDSRLTTICHYWDYVHAKAVPLRRAQTVHRCWRRKRLQNVRGTDDAAHSALQNKRWIWNGLWSGYSTKW